MKAPYLIQRMTSIKKSDGGLQKGHANSKIHELFSIDYMGSAEFEFGSFHKAVREMNELLSKRELVTERLLFKHRETQEGVQVYITARPEQVKEYLGYLDKIIDRKHRLKSELSSFRELFNAPTLTARYPGFQTVDAWFDIENLVMFSAKQDLVHQWVTALPNTVKLWDKQKEEKCK